MTKLLVSVADLGEAEIAVAAGADIVELGGTAECRAALDAARALVAALAGRAAASVFLDAPADPAEAAASVEAAAGVGVDVVRLPVPPAAGQRETIRALAGAAERARVIAVLPTEQGGHPTAILKELAGAHFHAAMLAASGRNGGRLLAQIELETLARFARAAEDAGLRFGFAGGLEAPDVPRLLALGPDLLGSALVPGSGTSIGREAVQAIRRLIPRERAAVQVGSSERPPSAGEAAPLERLRRVFVRDFVLPVRIGAYSHERGAPQQVRFDVSVEVRGGGAPTSMAGVFSYDLITDGIRAVVATGHVDFVETLAERIAQRLLADPRPERVTVSVEKLEIGPGGVGVEITLERPGRR